MAEPSYKVETDQLRRVAADPDCWWRWTDHAEARMEQRGYIADDVMLALTNGHVVRIDVQEDVVLRIKGQNIDGEAIEVAAAVYERTKTIKIVTVI